MNDNCYYSIDRLIEFGIGMSMAQQMVQMMNQTMSQMHIPGSIATIPQSNLRIYVAIEGKPVGPLADGEFSHLIIDKKVTKDTLAWMPGMLDWQPIEHIPTILKIVALVPPPIP